MRRSAVGAGLAAVLVVWAVLEGSAAANVALLRISTDPYTNSTSAHQTEVEPDTFAAGTTVVSAFQAGRFSNGGATNIGWATSKDSGATWTHGFLRGTTVFAGGTYDRISDPSVAYDAAHNTWLIAGLAIAGTRGAAVLVSRSTDGGTTWSRPVTVSATASGFYDKEWIVCDNGTAVADPYRGHCYVEWDDNGRGNLILMSTSTTGGASWGSPLQTANHATGLGGQPLVRPNGQVVVPIDNANTTQVLAFDSTNGGASWNSPTLVASIVDHRVAGSLRTEPLPTAEIDGAGKVYVVWQDCRFEPSCSANDLVMSTSAAGMTWSAVTRITADPVGSGVDHFIPGLAVDPSTAGPTAHLGLAFYYFPTANCTTSTCRLDVGYVSSTNGGSTWTPRTQLAGPMQLTWLAPTNQGYMVGDYISTSYSGGSAHPVFASATSKTTTFHESMVTPGAGLP